MFRYFVILIISLPELSTHFRPMFPFFTRFQGVQKRNICLKLVCNIVVLLFRFHFAFCLAFSLSILKGPTLPWNEIISRLFHLNEICDSIVSEQVSFRSRHQNVSGKSQKKEKVRFSVYYDYNHMNIICYYNHMLFFEKQNAFIQHLSCLTNYGLFLNANTIADASKTQSKYVCHLCFLRRLYQMQYHVTLTPQ